MKKIVKKASKNARHRNSIIDWDDDNLAQINSRLLLSSEGGTWGSGGNSKTSATGRFRSYGTTIIDNKGQIEVKKVSYLLILKQISKNTKII